MSALPWSPLLVIHRKKLFAGWKADPVDTYLLLNAGLIFLVFSLMVTKLPHYTLPSFPLIALCVVRRWKNCGLSPGTFTELGWITGFILALLTIVAVPVALANHATPSPVGVLVREARGVLTPETEFAVVDFQEPNAIWEMRRVVKGYSQPLAESQILSFLSQPGPHAVVLSIDAFGRLMGRRSATPGKVFFAHGFNAAKGRFNELALVVK